MHSVPSRSPVPRPATAPRVTHGSGIGSQARPTWGIWIRWSITASPANPASSAASATSRSHPSGSSPQGNRDTCSSTSTPVDAVRSPATARTRCWHGGRRWHTGATGAGSDPSTTGTTRSHPSCAISPATARRRASCPARTRAGSGRSRAALRRRHTSSGVSSSTTTAGSADRPRARQPARAAGRGRTRGCRRPSSGLGPSRAATIGLEHGERVGGGVEVVRAAAHEATQGVGGRRSPRRGSAAPPRSTCPTTAAPTSTTSAGSGSDMRAVCPTPVRWSPPWGDGGTAHLGLASNRARNGGSRRCHSRSADERASSPPHRTGAAGRPAPDGAAGDGDVRAGRRHVADERVHLGRRRGPRHHRQRGAVGDRPRGAGVGGVHPDQQQGRRPDRSQAGLRAGAAGLRGRGAGHDGHPEPDRDRHLLGDHRRAGRLAAAARRCSRSSTATSPAPRRSRPTP